MTRTSPITLPNHATVAELIACVRRLVDSGGTAEYGYKKRHRDESGNYLVYYSNRYSVYIYGERYDLQKTEDFDVVAKDLAHVFDPQVNFAFGYRLLEAAGIDLEDAGEFSLEWYRTRLAQYLERHKAGHEYPYWHAPDGSGKNQKLVNRLL